ncbi:amidase [uncultured Pantoea sp.]|uniref:amidase n=1 Tax=uncultured Pantoea sp. TaxID=218084 RepID=UPI0025893BE6|nr:amidase [uncultured Pantoea sp.]
MTTLWQASQMLSSGQAQPEFFTEAALSAVHNASGEGKRTFLEVFDNEARHQALLSGRRYSAGSCLSAIDGLPVSVKGLFDVAGSTTTAASCLLKNASVATNDAHIIRRLRSAGAVIVGKTNMTEFAFTGLGVNPHYGTPANPWRREDKRIPGGSSSGAAVAVSDGMCLGSVGTDTGGSVRIPAALCGLTGFKPSADRISLTGTLPLAVSLDSVGVIAHDVRSCWLLDSIIASVPLSMTHLNPETIRLAVPQTRVLNELDETVFKAWTNALACLRASGVTLTEIALEELAELDAMNARGGITAYEAWKWHQRYLPEHAVAYDPQVLSRIQRGSQLSAKDGEMLYAQRNDWKLRVENSLCGFDGFLMPTVPRIAPPLAELNDPARYMQVNALMLRNTSVINILDGCAVSLPCHQPGTAPVGLMICSTHGNDARLLSLALAIETLPNWRH